GYSLGLAASVLYLGAVGDRHGRKMMLMPGLPLSVPACLLAAFAPSDGVLFAARVLGGLSAGMAYPTTLALITALWSGPGRTRSIALWSAIGGGIASLGPLVAGALLEHFDWGSVFLITLPLVLVAVPLAWIYVPGHVNETTEPVDNLGGVRFTLLCGYAFLLLAFAAMLLLWKEGVPYWKVGIAYVCIGIGVGFAGTPASHSLTGSVPVRRAGMASGTADLQRDLGGAIMQSIFGALLTAGYAAAAGAAVAASGKQINGNVEAELTKSFSSAADTAQRYPASVQDQITAAAKTSFLQGDQWAYTAG